MPTLQDLEAQIAATYNAEFSRLRPTDLPAHVCPLVCSTHSSNHCDTNTQLQAAFALNRLQAYDEAGAKWSDLLLASQLREGVQVWTTLAATQMCAHALTHTHPLTAVRVPA